MQAQRCRCALAGLVGAVGLSCGSSHAGVIDFDFFVSNPTSQAWVGIAFEITAPVGGDSDPDLLQQVVFTRDGHTPSAKFSDIVGIVEMPSAQRLTFDFQSAATPVVLRGSDGVQRFTVRVEAPHNEVEFAVGWTPIVPAPGVGAVFVGALMGRRRRAA